MATFHDWQRSMLAIYRHPVPEPWPGR